MLICAHPGPNWTVLCAYPGATEACLSKLGNVFGENQVATLKQLADQSALAAQKKAECERAGDEFMASYRSMQEVFAALPPEMRATLNQLAAAVDCSAPV